MKKVVVETTGTTPLRKVNSHKYYAWTAQKIDSLQSLGFIVQVNYGQGVFRAYPLCGFTHGNSLTVVSGKETTLCQVIRKLTSEGYEVFEFDTSSEMFRWLINTSGGLPNI